MDRVKLATLWLGGCSGCHMSFLDLDEWLVELAARADVVFSPVVDIKQYPEQVDVALIEGAVCNEEHLEIVRRVRARTRIVVSFGDCAVTGNVTAMRNVLGKAEPVLQRAYLEAADEHPQIPAEPGIVPPLLDRVVPVHAVIPVDHYLPGCPPPADRIRALLEALLDGREPGLTGEQIKFG
ncbi:MAG: oxidoreductase [Verrucomicrobia bacterium]|nr:MAG: oxidoreductase [Verrucomicrobiota bacterium]